MPFRIPTKMIQKLQITDGSNFEVVKTFLGYDFSVTAYFWRCVRV